jgi:hypothetical protein
MESIINGQTVEIHFTVFTDTSEVEITTARVISGLVP